MEEEEDEWAKVVAGTVAVEAPPGLVRPSPIIDTDRPCFLFDGEDWRDDCTDAWRDREPRGELMSIGLSYWYDRAVWLPEE